MLEVRNLSKSYGDKAVIHRLSFSVPDHRIVAVIGPNGAGKSTLFQVLAGILPPDSGEVLANGTALQPNRATAVGFMPEKTYLPPFFSPWETLQYLNQILQIRQSIQQLQFHAEQFRIDGFLHAKNSTLSQGMMRRVSLAIAFLSNPSLLILDEPTNGMDIEGVLFFKETVLAAKARGATLLISSHILDFLSTIADDVLLLGNHHGQIAPLSPSQGLEAVYTAQYVQSEELHGT